MADQCIVCLDTLDANIPVQTDSVKPNVSPVGPKVAPPSLGKEAGDVHLEQLVAVIQTCGHRLHDVCLQAWVEKANSCPICRSAFHLVEVYDRVGGNLKSTYTVKDKKQVAEFDPAAWIDDQVEEFISPACPICDSSDNEEVLLLCDGCDAPYHTHCVGLDRVPHGNWFCMECVHEGSISRTVEYSRVRRQPRTFAQRTQAQVRRARRHVQADDWHGAWNQISGRVWEALNLDLDYSDDDQSLANYRSHIHRTERERREFQQWQQRLNIASRQGARDIFRSAARPILSSRERPQTPEQSPEEKKAWEAFDNVRESDLDGSSNRKRKAKSITRSPVEKSAEPERKLKRPKTRRVVNRLGSSSEGAFSNRRNSNVQAISSAAPPEALAESAIAPSFLSSLLKEVEMSTTTDDESVHHQHGNSGTSPSIEHSSPATSNYSTPRAMSITPPPYRAKRPGSPLPLTSHVEPIFPPADYSPNRSPPDHSHQSEGDRSGPASPSMSDIRQPRPRKKHPALPRSEESSPTRPNLTIAAKEGINKIVRTALEPHYKRPEGINKEQYAYVNRLVSHMLYDKIADLEALDEEGKSAWQQVATTEVTKAVESLSA